MPQHPASQPPWMIEQVNAFSAEEAVEHLGGLFELSPWIVRDTWPQRPFASRIALHAALCATMRAAPPDQHLALIRAHPDLVGQAALAGTLTRASTGEQAAAGLDAGQLSPDEIDTFTAYNAAYKERFGFPFVICARENRKPAILDGFQRRLANDRETEITTALGEIEKIAWYRLTDLVHDASVILSGCEGSPAEAQRAEAGFQSARSALLF